MPDAQAADQSDEAIYILNSFEKDVSCFEEKFEKLLQALGDAKMEDGPEPLQHLLLLEYATEESKVRPCMTSTAIQRPST